MGQNDFQLSSELLSIYLEDARGHLETLDHCLLTLEREGLVSVAREGRYLRCRADAEGLRELLTFLYAECCTRSGAVPRSALKTRRKEKRHAKER